MTGRDLLRPTDGNIPSSIRGASVETDAATRAYNCLGFCLGVRAQVRWLADDGPRTLEALRCRPLVADTNVAGTTIMLYEGPSPAYLHVVKLLHGNLCESKCGSGPRIVLRCPQQWYPRMGWGSLWFLDDADRRTAIDGLEANHDDGTLFYLPSDLVSGRRPTNLLPPLASVPDTLQDSGMSAVEAVKWLERQLDRAR